MYKKVVEGNVEDGKKFKKKKKREKSKKKVKASERKNTPSYKSVICFALTLYTQTS